MKRAIITLVGIVFVVVAIGFAGCKKSGGSAGNPYCWRKNEGAVWNTVYHISYNAPRDMTDSIQAIFREIEMSLSPFNESSTVSRLNRGELEEPDRHLDMMIILSTMYSEYTDGRFDPTVGGVVNLWKFGTTGKVASDAVWEPSQAQIDSAMKHVGIDSYMERLASDMSFAEASKGMTLNFSAITKGYAADMIVYMLMRNGATGAMAEIGGDVAVAGFPPHPGGWKVQIDMPKIEDGAPQHERLDVVEIGEGGVATSGNYRNFHNSSRGRVGHIIDPRTGRPADSPILSATVLAPKAAEADAIATAAMVCRSVDEAAAMLEENGYCGVLAYRADSCGVDVIRVQRVE